MSHVRFSFRSSLTRVCMLTCLASLVPAGTALAQSNPSVQVAGRETSVTLTRRPGSRVITSVPPGTVLEAIHVDGDPYVNQAGNWYLVALPRDSWGRRHIGWISGRQVMEVTPAEPADTMNQKPASPVPSAPAAAVTIGPPKEVAPPAVVTPQTEYFVDQSPMAQSAADDCLEVSEVVLLFEFDKSALTEAATSQLNSAVAMMKTSGQSVSFSLEGHTDSTGPDAYNERLGLARAESVKRHLAEQHEIPLDRIRIVSYGESRPASSNATREGRAQNRRVIVTAGG